MYPSHKSVTQEVMKIILLTFTSSNQKTTRKKAAENSYPGGTYGGTEGRCFMCLEENS